MRFFRTAELLQTLAEVFGNLAAGWFGSIIVFPGIWSIVDQSVLLRQLFFAFAFGTLSILLSSRLRKEAQYAN